MTYCSSKTVALPVEWAQQRIEEELEREGFDVLSLIDVQRTFSDRLNVAFRPYRIFGARCLALAHRSMAAEDMDGLMLPYNVVVQERGGAEPRWPSSIRSRPCWRRATWPCST